MKKFRADYNMPEIGTVAGVKVLMFYNDHAPPHVHLSKANTQVVIKIKKPESELLAFFTSGERKRLKAWFRTNQILLLANWELAHRSLPLFKIP